MKKITILFYLVLSTFLGFSQQEKKEFPLKNAIWNINGSWQRAEKVILNPVNEKKTKIISGNTIHLSKTAGNISSDVKIQDLKLKFEFLQSKNGKATLNLDENLSIIFDMQANSNFGAILKNKETTILPLIEAKRREGLWQKVEVNLSLNGIGGVPIIENVFLNDLLIHSNVLLSGIKISNNPISFTNQTGLFAFKHFEYFGLENKKPVVIGNLTYSLEETYNSDRSFESKNQAKVLGKSDLLTSEIPNNFNRYILHYKGDMNVDKDGLYGFTLDHQGTAKLIIDGQEIVGSAEYLYRNPISGLTNLKAGKHSFEFIYHPIYWRPVFGVEVSGSDFRPYALNDPKTLPIKQLEGGIFIDKVDYKARPIRSFLNFNGTKLTKVISVGTPQKIHYSFDLDNGSLLQVWKGQFADVTQMWHERGEPQILLPTGLLTTLNDDIPFFELNAQIQTKPDVYTEFINLGYELDENGIPTFSYKWKNTTFTQKFSPKNDGLFCVITADNRTEFGYNIASGKEIIKIEKNLYKVDNFYVEINENANAFIKNQNEIQTLSTNLNGAISYTLTW